MLPLAHHSLVCEPLIHLALAVMYKAHTHIRPCHAAAVSFGKLWRDLACPAALAACILLHNCTSTSNTPLLSKAEALELELVASLFAASICACYALAATRRQVHAAGPSGAQGCRGQRPGRGPGGGQWPTPGRYGCSRLPNRDGSGSSGDDDGSSRGASNRDGSGDDSVDGGGSSRGSRKRHRWSRRNSQRGSAFAAVAEWWVELCALLRCLSMPLSTCCLGFRSGLLPVAEAPVLLASKSTSTLSRAIALRTR